MKRELFGRHRRIRDHEVDLGVAQLAVIRSTAAVSHRSRAERDTRQRNHSNEGSTQHQERTARARPDDQRGSGEPTAHSGRRSTQSRPLLTQSNSLCAPSVSGLTHRATEDDSPNRSIRFAGNGHRASIEPRLAKSFAEKRAVHQASARETLRVRVSCSCSSSTSPPGAAMQMVPSEPEATAEPRPLSKALTA